MKQTVLVRSKQTSWFLAMQTLFNQVAAFYFEVIEAHRVGLELSSQQALTSFALRREFPQITQKLPSLRTRSYFASTAGNVSQQTIQRYLEAQKGL